jgi:hypothetical protein
MRFVLQPTVAIILGARSGVKYARAGLPFFIRAVVLDGAHRTRLLRNMFASIRDLVAIAIPGFGHSNTPREIHPGARCCSARSATIPCLVSDTEQDRARWISQIRPHPQADLIIMPSRRSTRS